MAHNSYSVIWFLPLLLSLAGCSTKSDVIPKSFEYISLQPGEKFAMVLNVEDMTITPQIQSRFGIPPSKLDVCKTDSPYICFTSSVDNLMFSFPKHLNEISSWEFQNKQFEIVDEIKSSNCGTDYIVKAEKDGVPTEIFKFNYGIGLKAVYYITNVEEIKLEFVAGQNYQFGEILIANGVGFGADGNCSRN